MPCHEFRDCGGPGSKKAALTFDDGPSEFTPALLDLLKRKNVKATWFPNGNRITYYVELLKRLYAEGHQIGSHGWSHPHMQTMSVGAVESELTQAAQAIKEVTNTVPRFFRPPFGETNDGINDLLDKYGYNTVYWNQMSMDYEYCHPMNAGPRASDPLGKGHGHTATSCAERMVEMVKDIKGNNAGIVILQHDIIEESMTHVEMIIDELKGAGYTFVRVDECYAYGPGNLVPGATFALPETWSWADTYLSHTSGGQLMTLYGAGLNPQQQGVTYACIFTSKQFASIFIRVVAENMNQGQFSLEQGASVTCRIPAWTYGVATVSVTLEKTVGSSAPMIVTKAGTAFMFTYTDQYYPPTNINFESTNAIYVMGELVRNYPTSEGTPPFTWSVSPSLPRGLSIHPETGLISGRPIELVPDAKTYTVSLSNFGGSSSVNLFMRVLPAGTGSVFEGLDLNFSGAALPCCKLISVQLKNFDFTDAVIISKITSMEFLAQLARDFSKALNVHPTRFGFQSVSPIGLVIFKVLAPNTFDATSVATIVARFQAQEKDVSSQLYEGFESKNIRPGSSVFTDSAESNVVYTVTVDSGGLVSVGAEGGSSKANGGAIAMVNLFLFFIYLFCVSLFFLSFHFRISVAEVSL